MSESNPYKDLIDHYKGWLFGLPDSGFLQPMLEARFSPDEAKLLAKIPFIGHTVEILSQKLGLDAEELREKLENFAIRGIVLRSESRYGILYALCDSNFVFYRSPGWKMDVDDWSREMANSQNHYWINSYAKDFLGHDLQGLRAVAINTTIVDTRKVMPYDDILKIIDGLDYYSVSMCPCSAKYNLDPEFEDCEHNFERCLHFGDLGKYCVEYGMGREITKEETFEILKRAAEEGLVHGVSNNKENIDTICNCCSHCLYLDFLVKMPGIIPRGHQPSNYIREINEDECIGCGVCVNRCPMNALELKDKKVIFEPERCIGCGVCVYKCNQDAIYLVHREKEENIPKNGTEQVIRYFTERGQDPSEAFKKNSLW